MKRHLFISLIVYFCAITCAVSFAAEKIHLAAKGKALMPIVISENADENIKKLASELAYYLKAITGAEFEIKTENSDSGIIVGTIGQFPEEKIAQKLEIRDTHDGKEAYAVKSERKDCFY